MRRFFYIVQRRVETRRLLLACLGFGGGGDLGRGDSGCGFDLRGSLGSAGGGGLLGCFGLVVAHQKRWLW